MLPVRRRKKSGVNSTARERFDEVEMEIER
jgi:hypothetical protein